LLCVSVSIHISFCGMTFHVIPSHESSGPFDFLDSLSLSLSLWILKIAFNTLIFYYQLCSG
jgi:hypothetical protein